MAASVAISSSTVIHLFSIARVSFHERQSKFCITSLRFNLKIVVDNFQSIKLLLKTLKLFSFAISEHALFHSLSCKKFFCSRKVTRICHRCHRVILKTGQLDIQQMTYISLFKKLNKSQRLIVCGL